MLLKPPCSNKNVETIVKLEQAENISFDFGPQLYKMLTERDIINNSRAKEIIFNTKQNFHNLWLSNKDVDKDIQERIILNELHWTALMYLVKVNSFNTTNIPLSDYLDTLYNLCHIKNVSSYKIVSAKNGVFTAILKLNNCSIKFEDNKVYMIVNNKNYQLA